MNGIINVYKPLGITSFDVVFRVRRALGVKKVGHTGTLDPDAEGVLPVCIGKGTKVADFITASEKGYRATLRLGITTDTQDIGGTVLKECTPDINYEAFCDAVNSFVGKINQIPPMYSAIKVQGKKLYELARAGIEIERKPREIEIKKIEIISFDGLRAVLDVECSKGTYIRTLCHDIGEKLGCGGCMSALTRTKSGRFLIKDAVPLEKIESGEAEKYIIPIDEMFDYPKVTVKGETERRVLNGNSVSVGGLKDGTRYKVYGEDGSFLCISEQCGNLLKLIQSFY